MCRTFRNSETPKACYGGNKLTAQALQEKEYRFDRINISAFTKANLRKQKLITSLLQTIVEGQWPYREIKPCGVFPAIAAVHHSSYNPRNASG